MRMYIITILALLYSCTPEPLPKPFPCKLPDCSDTVKYVWKRPDSLGQLKILWYSMGHSVDTSYTDEWCYATEDGVITICPSSLGRNRAYVRKLDRMSGRELWFWDGINTDSYSDVQFVGDRNLCIVKQWSHNAILDINSGTPLFNTVIPAQYETSNPEGTIEGNYFYISSITQDRNSGKGHEFSKLLRTRIDDGKSWEEIFTINDYDKDGYGPNIYNVAQWINPNTLDTILLLNVRLYHWERAAQGADPSTLERSDVVAYNLSKRKVEWSADSVCKVSQVVNAMHILNNKLYFETDVGTSIIDLLQKGKILKNVYAGIDFIDEPNDRIIGRIDGDIVIFDTNLLIMKRIRNQNYFATNNLELFENNIYTVNLHDSLFVYNINSGKKVYQHFSVAMFVPQSILGMMGRCSVDKKNRLLYCSDRYGVYCLQLPDKWE